MGKFIKYLFILFSFLSGLDCKAQTDSLPAGMPRAVELGWRTFHPGNVSLPLDSNSDSVLRALFPGKYYKEIDDDNDTISAVWWVCRECLPVLSVYDYMPELSENVPDTAWNTTLVLFDTIVKGKNCNYRYFFFYHTSEIFPEFCGRFRGANTGAARFCEVNGKWELTNFNPVLGAFGTFGRPSKVVLHEITAGEHIFTISYANGGAGGAYTGYISVFMAIEKSFFRSYREDFAFMYNSGSGEWETQIKTLEDNGKNDIVFETSGVFNGDGTDMYGETESVIQLAPEELKMKMLAAQKNGSTFKFILKRVFSVSAGKWVLKSTNLEIL